MDTSPEYISMCEKAHELQQMWAPYEGDWYICTDEHGQDIYTLGYTHIDLDEQKRWETTDIAWTKVTNIVWLPRIDQLINMSHENWQHFVEKCAYNSEYWIPKNDHTTMEVQAIQRIMGRQYNKYWDGEKWT